MLSKLYGYVVHRFTSEVVNYKQETHVLIPGKRILEISSLSVSIFLLIINGYYIIKFFLQCGNVARSFVCGISAVLTADFLSGIVHWIADTWGTTDAVIVGEVKMTYLITAFLCLIAKIEYFQDS